MPLTDGTQVSVPATSTTNAFLGRPIEFIGVAATARLLAIADAIGMQQQVLINVGSVQLAPMASGVSVNVSSAAGAGPKDDEDTVLPLFSIPAGARSQYNLTNTTAAAIINRWRALIN